MSVVVSHRTAKVEGLSSNWCVIAVEDFAKLAKEWQQRSVIAEGFARSLEALFKR
jgi:hypothetical protein